MHRDIRVLRLLALAAAIVMPAIAAAQAPPKVEAPIPSTNDQLDPNACAPHQGTVGQGGEDTRKADGKNLSEKLAQSGGVLCPPSDVDPAIKAPTPDTGRTPVIPPPGSPGGDPNVRPK